MMNNALEQELQKYIKGKDLVVYYDIGKLHKIMSDLGLTTTSRYNFTRRWFGGKIRKGVLIVPPRPEGTREYRISGADIKGIIHAFAPGGEGFYDYRNKKH